MRLHTSHSLDYVENVQAGFDDLMRAFTVSGYVSPLGGTRPREMRMPTVLLPLLVNDLVLRTIERATRKGIVCHEGHRPKPAQRARKPKRTSAEHGAAIKAGIARKRAEQAQPSAVRVYVDRRAELEARVNAAKAAAFEAERLASYERLKARGLL